MGSLKQSYLFKLLKSILVISFLFAFSSFGDANFYNIYSEIIGEGRVVPGKDVKVKAGNKKKVKFFADSAYIIDSVIIDYQNLGSINEFIFENIASDHYITLWISSIVPETTIVLTEEHIINIDTVIEVDTSFLATLDTVINKIFIEKQIKYDIVKTESFSDGYLYATLFDTTININSIQIFSNSDTFSYKPTITVVKNEILLSGIDTVIASDNFVNWDNDTIIITKADIYKFDTIIIVIDSLIDGELVSSFSDTSYFSEVSLLYEKTDTLIHTGVKDATPIDYYSDNKSNLEIGFSAGPNPYNVEDGGLKFVYKSKMSIANAKIWIYDKLGNLIDNLTIYDRKDNNSIVFEWDGITNHGNFVNTSSVIAIVHVNNVDGSEDKKKIVVGIKRF